MIIQKSKHFKLAYDVAVRWNNNPFKWYVLTSSISWKFYNILFRYTKKRVKYTSFYLNTFSDLLFNYSFVIFFKKNYLLLARDWFNLRGSIINSLASGMSHAFAYSFQSCINEMKCYIATALRLLWLIKQHYSD